MPTVLKIMDSYIVTDHRDRRQERKEKLKSAVAKGRNNAAAADNGDNNNDTNANNEAPVSGMNLAENGAEDTKA